MPPRDPYAFDGTLSMVLAIVTLQAGPWPFNILGFFIAALAAAPAILWALQGGWWPAILAASWLIFAAGRRWQVDVLPSQSERPFPILIWQASCDRDGDRLAPADPGAPALRRAPPGLAIGAVAVTFAPFQLVGETLVDAAAWAAWQGGIFDKGSLVPPPPGRHDFDRSAPYLLLRRPAARAERALRPVLLPLGRNSFYVFIMHVFVCLAIARVRRSAARARVAGNALVQAGWVALLVRRRFLSRWVPR